MTIESNVTLLDSVFLQEVDNETILLDINTEEYFSLNEIAGVFYQLLKEESSLAKVLEELKECFEVPQEQLKTDLIAFVKALKEKGLVTIS